MIRATVSELGKLKIFKKRVLPVYFLQKGDAAMR
jgi:hypothetical protein